jgi:DNA-binding IclR family transcriptional regulator
MQSLSRALSVLDLLGRQSSPQTLADITKHVGLHKSTVHRMLATFVDYGLVRRDEANRYLVGSGAIELARVAQGEAPWTEVVRIPLGALSEFAYSDAAFAVPRGSEMVRTNVARTRESQNEAPAVGETTRMHESALGLAYLAHRPRYELDRYVERTELAHHVGDQILGASALLRCLARVRDSGYSFEPGETPLTATAIAFPVLAADGYAIAAVQLSVSADTYGPDLNKLARATRACAERISVRLAGPGSRPVMTAPESIGNDRRGA